MNETYEVGGGARKRQPNHIIRLNKGIEQKVTRVE